MRIACPHCGVQGLVRHSAAGGQVRCTKCGRAFKIPAREEPNPSAAPSWRSEPVFLYDAFISYRHLEEDRRWAKWVHSQIETYRVPTRIRKPGMPAQPFRRVFRDEDELPASADLHAEIEEALAASRFLIVVCSRDTPFSRWVNEEVKRFRELGRSDQVIALLIDGSPSESFPDALRLAVTTEVDALGNVTIVRKAVEPIAADVRYRKSESQVHLKRMAKLRILACLLNCGFDELRQRHQERARMRMIRGSAGACVLILTILLLFFYARYHAGRADAAESDFRHASEELDSKKSELTDTRSSLVETEKQLGSAEERAEEAKKETTAAENQKARALASEAKMKCVEHIGLARSEFERGNVQAARAALANTEEEFRDFEWYYLRGATMGVNASIDFRHVGAVSDAILVRAGELFVTTSEATAKTWDPNAVAEVRSASFSTPIAFSDATDDQLALSFQDESAAVYALDTLQLQYRLEGTNKYQFVRFSPDGASLVARYGKSFLLFDARSGRRIGELPRAQAELWVDSPRFTSDSGYLVSMQNAWELPAQRPLIETDGPGTLVRREGYGRFELHLGDSNVEAIDVASAAPVICFASNDIVAYSFEREEPRILRRIVPREGYTAIAASPDGSQVAVALSSGAIEVWPTGSEEAPDRLVGHEGVVSYVRFTADGERLTSAGQDGSARIWTLGGSPDAIHLGFDAALFPDRPRYSRESATWMPASSSTAEDLNWRLVDGALISNGDLQVVAHLDLKYAELIGRRARELTASIGRNLHASETQVTAGQFNEGFYGRSAVEFERSVRRDMSFLAETPLEWAQSLDGTFIAAVENFNRLVGGTRSPGQEYRFVEITKDSEVVHVIDEHEGAVYALAFSPTSTRLATGGADGVLRLWDVETWMEVLSLEMDAEIIRVVFSPEGDRLWVMTPHEVIALEARGCRRVGLQMEDAAVHRRNPELFAREGPFASLSGKVDLVEDALRTAERLLTELGHPATLVSRTDVYRMYDIAERAGAQGPVLDALLLIQQGFVRDKQLTTVNFEGEGTQRPFILVPSFYRWLEHLPGHACVARGEVLEQGAASVLFVNNISDIKSRE